MSIGAITLQIVKSEYLVTMEYLDALASEFFGSLMVAAGHEDAPECVIAFQGEHLGFDPLKQIHVKMDPLSNRANLLLALASFRPSTSP